MTSAGPTVQSTTQNFKTQSHTTMILTPSMTNYYKSLTKKALLESTGL